jgi:hypothetical protein
MEKPCLCPPSCFMVGITQRNATQFIYADTGSTNLSIIYMKFKSSFINYLINSSSCKIMQHGIKFNLYYVPNLYLEWLRNTQYN